MAQRRRVILVRIATGDLVEPLLDERIKRMTTTATTPLGNLGSEGGGQPKRVVSLPQPDQAAIRGQRLKIEGGMQRTWLRGEADGR
jgi:hypothetical protein